MDFTRITLPEQSYLYVDRECPYGPQIAEAMGSGFGEVFGFVGANNITPQSMPMSVYVGMDPDILRFRAAVMVSPDDMAKASGDIKSATLPAGEAITVTHIGAYDMMNQTHQALWSHMEEHNIPAAMPIWEIYVNDPDETPEAALKTEIYRMIG